MTFRKPAVILSSDTEAPNLVAPLEGAVFGHRVP